MVSVLDVVLSWLVSCSSMWAGPVHSWYSQESALPCCCFHCVDMPLLAILITLMTKTISLSQTKMRVMMMASLLKRRQIIDQSIAVFTTEDGLTVWMNKSSYDGHFVWCENEKNTFWDEDTKSSDISIFFFFWRPLFISAKRWAQYSLIKLLYFHLYIQIVVNFFIL